MGRCRGAVDVSRAGAIADETGCLFRFRCSLGLLFLSGAAGALRVRAAARVKRAGGTLAETPTRKKGSLDCAGEMHKLQG